MQTISLPSYSLSEIKHFTHRKVIAYAFIIVGFADIITTYFGIEVYHLQEKAVITKWLLTNFGWTGATIRTTLITLFLCLYYRYISNRLFKLTFIPSWFILVVYFFSTTFNNCLLMFLEELNG
jgi:uncharacterized membrane protein